MFWLQQLAIEHFVVFTLVLSRVSGLVMTAPIYGTTDIPMRIRGFLAFALAVLITPTQLAAHAEGPGSIVNYLVLAGGELLIGVALGLGIVVLFSGIQVAGQIIGQMSGMSLADVFNPGFDDQVPVFSQLLYYVTLAIFVMLGGHRRLMDGLLGTFAAFPPGQVSMPDTVGETVASLLTQSFVLGIRAAAPAMVALLLTTLVLGFISRTLPQLNILAFGFSLSSLVTFCTLAVSLGTMAWIFQQQIDPAIEIVLDGLQRQTAISN
jgi:flagellar biosynthetic protein FliR